MILLLLPLQNALPNGIGNVANAGTDGKAQLNQENRAKGVAHAVLEKLF